MQLHIWHMLIQLSCSDTCYTLYSGVMMSAMASQMTSVSIVCTTVCSGGDEKKTLKLHVTGLCESKSLVASEFPTQRASNTENVSIWWHHHVWRWYWINNPPFFIILKNWENHGMEEITLFGSPFLWSVVWHLSSSSHQLGGPKYFFQKWSLSLHSLSRYCWGYYPVGPYAIWDIHPNRNLNSNHSKPHWPIIYFTVAQSFWNFA